MLKFNFSFIFLSYFFSSICYAEWTTTPPQLISQSYTLTYGSVFTSFDSTNQIFLATWADGNNSQLPTYSFYSSNTGWSPIATISNSSSAENPGNVFTACNPLTGQFIATWTDLTTFQPIVSVYNSGLGWSPIDPLTTTQAGFNTYSSFDSATESFLVTWADSQNNDYPTYAFYTPNGGWGTIGTITTLSTAANVYTTYDPVDNLFLAVWTDIGTGFPMYSFYESGSWSPVGIISPLADVANDVFSSYNPITGQFIATWSDINQNLFPFYSIYSNGSWSPIDTITTTTGVTDNVTISCDSISGEFLAVWSNILNGNPTYSFYQEGLGWTPPEVISPLSLTTSDIFTCFNSSSREFLSVWANSDINFLFDPTYSFFTFIPLPPLSFNGNILKNYFLNQTDIIHKLVWTPPVDTSDIVFYQISRNGVVIADVPVSGPFVYYDHHRNQQQDVYTIVSVSASGNQSPPLSITL